MIHVHRAANAQELKAPSAEPILVAIDRPQLESALDTSPLTPNERAAVKRAAAQIGIRDARIIIAADGTVFRVEKVEGEPTPAQPAGPLSHWRATARGAPVLVASTDSGWNRRAAAALRFLGYAATPVEGPTLAALEKTAPAVLLVAGSALTPELLDAARSRCAVVALDRAGAPPRLRVSAVLRLPVDWARVSAVLDPLILKGQSGPKREKPTPRS